MPVNNSSHIKTSPPNVDVVLVPHPECYLWRVLHCPICGRSHTHGAGLPGADHDSYLGHRVADCGPGGYILVKAQSHTP